MINYPIGIHTFEGIRREHYVYVDKTELVYRLKRGGRHYLLCRPRLFGKSLLLSTLQSYFKGEKELFQGLMIADLEKSWHKHAILKFDFYDPTLGQEDALDRLIDKQLHELEQLYGGDEYGGDKNESSLKDRFLGLIERAYQASQHGVVILIDNYDSPLLLTMEEGAIQSHYIEILTEFYSVLPKALDKIRFSFICGITAIGKSSFLKDYVYSGSEISKSCNLKSHYKSEQSEKSAHSAVLERVSIEPSEETSPQNTIEQNTIVEKSVLQTAIPFEEKEVDSPVECQITPELPSYTSEKIPLLPESDDCVESEAELVNDDNSISATSADSRFAATASEDFIPMDADPAVKVIIDPTLDKEKSDELSNGDGNIQTNISSEVRPADRETTPSQSKVKVGQGAPTNNEIIPTTSAHTSIEWGHSVSTAFIRDISLDSAFTGLCGFSEEEILDNMRPGLERLAQYKESDVQSVMEAFSRRYYGYHFNIKGHGKFNPYDVFNALSQDRIGDYWCSVMRRSGIKDLVISKIMASEFDMRLLKECKIPKSELERDPFELDSPVALLYQCGYLTIMGHGPQDKMYYLTISNKEVREEFLSELLDCYGCYHHEKNNYITAMLEDLQNGFPEIFVVRMKSFFQDPEDAGYCRFYPQTSALKMTNFPLYCQNILYLVFTLLSKDVLDTFGQEIGYEINDGNAELIMQFDHSIYIFEFVLDRDMNSGLRLIQQRHLQAPVIYEGKQIVKVCVSVSSELRNISSWFVEKDESPEYQSDGDQASAFPLFSPHDF